MVDEHTVAIHLTTPYYGVLNDLAMCNPMGIVSPNAFNEDLTTKEELLTQTMGTGPICMPGTVTEPLILSSAIPIIGRTA